MSLLKEKIPVSVQADKHYISESYSCIYDGKLHIRKEEILNKSIVLNYIPGLILFEVRPCEDFYKCILAKILEVIDTNA